MGTAGTGKSYLIKALQQSLDTYLQTSATTGVAAFNIHGQTIHSLMKLPITDSQKQPLSGQSLKEFQLRMKGIKYVIIDEVSMLKQDELNWINQRLQQASGKTAAFGGYNIICVGDFAQLPPVMSCPLYTGPNDRMKSFSSNGYVLYRQFDTVVLLDKIKRQDSMLKMYK